jgi:hypothetical protein
LVYGSYPDLDGRARSPKTRGDPAEDAANRLRTDDLCAIWQLAFINGTGPRVGESGFGLIPRFPYTSPYDDFSLKGA